MQKRFSYLTFVLAGSFVILSLVAGFNAFIDPYSVFGTQRISMLNAQKPFAGDRGRVSKLYESLRVSPRGLVVGNSRPEMGLDPDHPCWPADARPVYNAALPGLGVYNQVRYAQHAQAEAPARALVMAVDFVDFLSRSFPNELDHWPPVSARGEDEVFAVDPQGLPVDGFGLRKLSDMVDAVLSLDALGHSLVTVARQGGSVPTRTSAGFNVAEGIYAPIIRREGMTALAGQKNAELALRYRGGNLKVVPKGKSWSPDFEAVKRLIEQGNAAGTVTVLAVNPLHAEYLLLLDAAGLWPQMEEWRRIIAQIGRDQSVPVWDFNLFDPYSTQSIASLAPRGEGLKWFWEPSHYRQELGDLMLANIWRDQCPSERAEAPAYGVRLDQMSDAALEAFLAEQRLARDTFKKSQPEVAKRIRSLSTAQ